MGEEEENFVMEKKVQSSCVRTIRCLAFRAKKKKDIF